MIRLLIKLFFIIGLALILSWLADHPGSVTLTWGEYVYETSLLITVSTLIILTVVVLFIILFLNDIFNIFGSTIRFLKSRKRKQGYQALSEGILAINAGDIANAKQLTKKSKKLIANEPLLDVLEAQTDLVAGYREKGLNKFEAMLDDPRTRLVALRNLFIEAEKSGDKNAAKQFAEKASQLSPSLSWSADAVFRFHCAEGEWQKALETLNHKGANLLIDKAKIIRYRAVLLTALALEQEDTNPVKAVKLAREAAKIAHDMVPASLTAGRLYTRLGETRKATKILEKCWISNPHPQIAEQYVRVRHGDTVTDRLNRAERLLLLDKKSNEGHFAVAVAAISAKNWVRAREVLAYIIKVEPSERVCHLMAEIEQSEHGDRGRMREWLTRALKAPKDAVWIADGTISQNWFPVSPVNGQLDAFEWRVPFEKPPEQIKDLDFESLLTPIDNKHVKTEDLLPSNEKKLVKENVKKAKTVKKQIFQHNLEKKQTSKEEKPHATDTKKVVFPLSRSPDDPGVDNNKDDTMFPTIDYKSKI